MKVCLILVMSLVAQVAWASISEGKIVKRQEMTVVLMKQTVNANKIGPQVAKSIQELQDQLKTLKIEPLSPPFERRVEFAGDNYVYEVGFAVKSKTVLPATAKSLRIEKIPAGKAVLLTVMGPYTQFSDVGAKIEKTLKANKAKAKGTPMVIYRTNPQQTSTDKLHTDVFQLVQ